MAWYLKRSWLSSLKYSCSHILRYWSKSRNTQDTNVCNDLNLAFLRGEANLTNFYIGLSESIFNKLQHKEMIHELKFKFKNQLYHNKYGYLFKSVHCMLLNRCPVVVVTSKLQLKWNGVRTKSFGFTIGYTLKLQVTCCVLEQRRSWVTYSWTKIQEYFDSVLGSK
jgi:hypothetical protein